MRDPAAAAELFAVLRRSDSPTAVTELSAWLRELEAISDRDEIVHGQILALMLEAAEPHISALLAPFLARSADWQKGPTPTWPLIDGYLPALAQATCTSAARTLKMASNDSSLQGAAAACAARALRLCRQLMTARLVRYLDLPSQAWRMAYGVHRDCESTGLDALPVRMHGGHHATTTATKELLRLLMLRCSAPDMMSPAQIHVADWVCEQLGDEFTLRPRGVTDNPFCFDPAGEAPPCRADELRDGNLRYLGPGVGYQSLERMQRQIGGKSDVEPKNASHALPAHVRLSAMAHLLAFWGEKSPYTPPLRTPAAASLQVVHGYSQAWQQLTQSRTKVRELTLAEDGDVPLARPDSWTLHDTGGSELGVEVPKTASDSIRCGDVLAVSMDEGREWWLGLVRSMHALEDHRMHATIHVMGRQPAALQARAVIEEVQERGVTEQAARQFSFSTIRAIVISDGSGTAQPPNMLLPPDAWKAGRRFELAGDEGPRFVRCSRFLRQGDDYVRVAFDWEPAGSK